MARGSDAGVSGATDNGGADQAGAGAAGEGGVGGSLAGAAPSETRTSGGQDAAPFSASQEPEEPGSVVADAVRAVTEERSPSAPAETRTIRTEDRPEAVVAVVLGLLALMALAYLGGHPSVLALEARLGISQVITAGLPFIVLGLIARLPSVGLLSYQTLSELSPLLRIGLGSIGFVTGFRFDVRLVNGLPRGAATTAMLSTLLPALAVSAATAPLLLLFSGASWSASLHDPVFIRDALILATAGAMTARSALPGQEGGARRGVAARILRLEEVAGVIGLALIAAYFRPRGVDGAWHLPGAVWVLLTLGLGTALGLLFYAMLTATPRGPDFLAVALGSIAFAAGAAGYLHLSSVAVAFVAGVILANFPGAFQPGLRDMLKRIERPIYLLSLVVIGALWNVRDWRGWLLMPAFMAARLAGKWLAATIAARSDAMPISPSESRALAVSPVGALAIAIVVNAELLYPGGSISRVVSAVIGGGVLTEVFVQLVGRAGRSDRPRRGPDRDGSQPPAGSARERP